MRRRAALLAVAGLLLVGGAARAEETGAPAAQGTWSATTTGGKVLGGFWTAEDVSKPDVAIGAWTLVDEHGKTVMNGSWSARKAPRGWRGSWSARVGGSNQIYSGTWEADTRTLKGAKTFRDLLDRTATKQIAGVWRMGRSHGNWWLKAK